jgi:hypothetical protein
MVKDFMLDGDKRELLANRAENILNSLKHRFPGLTQTTLDTCKIQCNKVPILYKLLNISLSYLFSLMHFLTLTNFTQPFQDVGKSILESYSRVLESMAFNIVSRIDDLSYVDDLTKHSDKFALVPHTTVSQQKISRPFSVSVSGTPHKAAFGTPKFSPVPLISPARGERTPFLHNNNNNNNVNIKPQRRGFGVRRALSNYLGGETKTKTCPNSTEVNCSNPSSKKTEQSEQQHQKETCAVQNKTK